VQEGYLDEQPKAVDLDRVPRMASLSENQNIGREVARIEMEAASIAI
jgi:hypothetical protein